MTLPAAEALKQLTNQTKRCDSKISSHNLGPVGNQWWFHGGLGGLTPSEFFLSI